MSATPKELGDLTEALVKILKVPRLILFAGAGVSARAGIPTWGVYLDHLASICEQHGDKTSGLLIREKVKSGDYLGAATIYKLCGNIPQGVQLAELAAPFSKKFTKEQLSPLVPLMECGFSSVVTTNYDRVLHHVYSTVAGEAPLQLQLDDDTLRNAALKSDFYIARIHGRCEKPESIILNSIDYLNLGKNDGYLDFLLDLLTHRPCLFFGFSFVDPAIKHVLNIFKERKGPNYPTLHYAILPATSGGELGALLTSLNISVVYYDDKDKHKAIWQAVRAARDKIVAQPTEQRKLTPKENPDTGSFGRFMAFAYAQIHSKTDQVPVLESVQEGLVLSLLEDRKGEPADDSYLIAGVRQALSIDVEQASRVVSLACRRLIETKEVVQTTHGLKATKREASPLKSHIHQLAEDVGNRYKVRESKELDAAGTAATAQILERLFLVRAWDLAAHYAGAGTGYAMDLPEVVFRLVEESYNGLDGRKGLGEAIYDLLTSPTDEEAALLAELGRCALAVQLVLSSPRQTLFHRYVLPETIYLDSNILLPLLVEGHPFRPAYIDAVNRLTDAARSSGLLCKLVVAAPFLNEVISHRRIAVDLVNDLGLDDPDKLWQHITFYGASNTNVFVGAFSNHVGRQKRKIKFNQFLQSVAPYENEKELESYIKRKNISCFHLDYKLRNSTEKAALMASLIQGYEEVKRRQLENKETILIQHEAEQLLVLRQDIEQRKRSVFVTADMQLQGILRNTKAFTGVASSTVSQIGFLGMVDIMVGLNADRRSLARMMWAMPRTDSQHQVRDYLIARVLKEYDVALTLAMHNVIDQVVEESVNTAKREKVNLSGGDKPDDIARTAKFLDRYENKFFKLMAEELDKQK